MNPGQTQPLVTHMAKEEMRDTKAEILCSPPNSYFSSKWAQEHSKTSGRCTIAGHDHPRLKRGSRPEFESRALGDQQERAVNGRQRDSQSTNPDNQQRSARAVSISPGPLLFLFLVWWRMKRRDDENRNLRPSQQHATRQLRVWLTQILAIPRGKCGSGWDIFDRLS